MGKKEQARRTKAAIVEAAADLIQINGFRATSVNEIVDHVGMTKGAFFHHFKNKKELGYAIIDYWRDTLHAKWVKPLEGSTDPLTDLHSVPHEVYSGYTIEDIAKGCPLANLATELSPIDDDFRERIQAIYEMLEKGVSGAIIRGQDEGTVSLDANPVLLARFYEDLMAGTRSVSKNTLDRGRMIGTLELFRQMLETYRV